jgi:hypothetical protein
MTRWTLLSSALLALGLLTNTVSAWVPSTRLPSTRSSATTSLWVNPIQDKEKKVKSAEETTEKFGLEAGLFQSMKKEDGGESAKSLLKRYGVAYLATSIPLAIISYTLCFFLVDNGVDVASLLAKVGIENSGATETAGTAAIAYAAHKAASPIRFPPTVILTPIVAKLIGKDPEEVEVDEEAS